MRNFKCPLMKRWQCPINNGTLRSFSDQVLNRALHVSLFLTVHFDLWFLCKSDLRISYLQERQRYYQDGTLFESGKQRRLPYY